MKKLSMEELNRLSPKEFKEAEKNKIVVVLDNIRSMHNVGSLFRTADSFLIQAVILCGFTPQPPHREIHKTALGSTETVDWLYFESTKSAILSLKNEGYIICAIEQVASSVKLNKYTFDKNKKYALVFGNEVQGVTQEALNMCDLALEIPQGGTKHSLNISVAAGIVLWESVRAMW